MHERDNKMYMTKLDFIGKEMHTRNLNSNKCNLHLAISLLKIYSNKHLQVLLL